MKILAVDDNEDNIQLIIDIVEDMGHDVIMALDGTQALDIIEQDLPDLILLDVNMPGMTGFEVLEHLKAVERTASIPVIMLTALAGVDHRVEGFGLGAEDYLVKPFSPLELIARIEARLRTKVQTDGLREMQKIVRSTFERFVAPSVVKQLLEDPTTIKLGGVLKNITVFFADIENFTSISEVVPPELLLSVLNRYHEHIVDVVQVEQGTVDKFMGDAVMALFNTPLEIEDHAFYAVRAACAIRDGLKDFYQDIPEQFHLQINFGIHTGTAVVGNVGAPQIMDYTAVGDTVNVAARLQDFARGGQILISQATYDLVADRVEIVTKGERVFKGRTEPVVYYDVQHMKN
jgi:adenylate cyclase